MGPNAPAYVTRLAESAKHSKYGGLCTARGIQHLPAAFNTYGGWGEEILDKLIEPFFNRLRADVACQEILREDILPARRFSARVERKKTD